MIQKEIDQIKRDIEMIEERLKKLKSELETIENKSLIEFQDFPLRCGTVYVQGIDTVYALVHSSPDELLKIPGIGKVKLNRVIQWMEKHGLDFV